MPEFGISNTGADFPATVDLLKFADYASNGIKSVLVGSSKSKRKINRRKYLRKQVNRYRETKFNENARVSSSLWSLFDVAAQTNPSDRPFRMRNLPSSFFNEPQRNPSLDRCIRQTDTSMENLLHLPPNCSRTYKTNSCIYENDSSDVRLTDNFCDERFVPSVSMESLAGLEEWDYIDSINSTLVIDSHSTIP